MDQTNQHSCCHEPAKRKWYGRLLPLVSLGTVLLLAVSYAFEPLNPFRTAWLDYLKIVGWAVAAGLAAGGVIDYYVPQEYISKLLAASRKRTIFLAAILGFLSAACSHGILALSMQLYKKGASGPAVVSFLLAAPWANLPLTLILIGFFGIRGIAIIAAALVVAILTGLILQTLEKKKWIETNPGTVAVTPDFSISKDIRRRVQSWKPGKPDLKGIISGTLELADMVLGWILIGMFLASVVSAYVPAHMFMKYLGPSAAGLILTLLLATILEVCSEGTSMLAFEIYKQTGAFGNTFAFLMGGVITDYTEIGLVWKNIGRRTALWMVAVSVPMVFVIGLVFNRFVQ